MLDILALYKGKSMCTGCNMCLVELSSIRHLKVHVKCCVYDSFPCFHRVLSKLYLNNSSILLHYRVTKQLNAVDSDQHDQ